MRTRLPPQHPTAHRRHAQRGIAVLHVTLMLVLLGSLAVFYASRAGINEQRMSANEVRSQAAYEAALAGLDDAVSYVVAGRDVSLFPAAGATAPAGGTLTRASYRVQFCSPGAVVPPCPANATIALTCTAPTGTALRSPVAVSCGWSDDARGGVQMVQMVAGSPAAAGSVTTPMVTYGSNNMLTGGGSILNYFSDLTVWSGGSVPTQSSTGKTFVRDMVSDPTPTPATVDYRDVGTSPSCVNPPAHYLCSSSGTTLGPDVIANDTALSTLSYPQFFASFMGATPNDYRASKPTYSVDPGQAASATNATSLANLPADKRSNQVLWVEGSVTSQMPDLGTPTAPVILVINGNWDASGSPVINGLVIVTGTVSGTGNPRINGALIANQVTLTGNAVIVFDPGNLAIATRLGAAAPVPGSFRDWRAP